MNVNRGLTPLVLMCPAWRHWGQMKTVMDPVLILHSRGDEVIPYGDSLELIRASGLPLDRLIETGVEHRLACPQALQSMEEACRTLDAPLPPGV